MRSRWMSAAAAAGMWMFALAVYARLPERVPSHWNLQGEVDGWMPRIAGAFLLPAIATVLAVLHGSVRRVDPRAENVDRFAGDWRLILNLVTLFMGVMHVATLGYALGWPVDVARLSPAAVGLLFVGVGNYLPRTRSNWFMGIRTPWTMDNERVWRATHRLGGRVFVVAGLALVLSALLSTNARAVVLAAAVGSVVVIPLVYSYVAWRRDVRGNPL